MSAAFLRKYATATTSTANIRIPIIKRAAVDFAVSADWTPAAGDVKVSKDGGAAANIGTLPTAVTMGNTAYWEFTFTGTELTAKTVIVTVADSSTKVVEDQAFIIETYGHASALYAVDFDDAVRFGLTALPNAAAEASGGLVTRGTGTGQLSVSSGAVILAAAGLDAVVVETGMNARQALSAASAATAGVLSGAGTGTIVVKGAGVATTRITATTDGDGNRSAITLNLPA